MFTLKGGFALLAAIYDTKNQRFFRAATDIDLDYKDKEFWEMLVLEIPKLLTDGSNLKLKYEIVSRRGFIDIKQAWETNSTANLDTDSGVFIFDANNISHIEHAYELFQVIEDKTSFTDVYKLVVEFTLPIFESLMYSIEEYIYQSIETYLSQNGSDKLLFYSKDECIQAKIANYIKTLDDYICNGI